MLIRLMMCLLVAAWFINTDQGITFLDEEPNLSPDQKNVQQAEDSGIFYRPQQLPLSSITKLTGRSDIVASIVIVEKPENAF